MKHLLWASSVLFMGLLCGCAHQTSDGPTVVRMIQISDSITPATVYAKSGEEIRWQNLRTKPVRVGFLSGRLLDDLGCRKGVTTFFGEMSDLITIAPGESVSVCPLRTGTLQYNVWFDVDNPKGSISPTATVHVEAGSGTPAGQYPRVLTGR